MKIKNCSIMEFIEKTKNCPVVAIGVGSEIMDWSEKEDKEYEPLVNSVTYFVDNDSKKWGKQVELFHHTYKIHSLREIEEKGLQNVVFVITCMAYLEIINQLEKMPQFDETECYYSVCMNCSPHMDLNNFIKNELTKDAMVNYKNRLRQRELKNKYKGERCFIIGNGPSLRAEDLDKLQHEISFASNFIFNIYENTRWRPTYYAVIDYYILAKIPDFYQKNRSSTIFVPRERALALGKVYDDVLYFDRHTSYVRADNDVVEKTNNNILFSDNLEEEGTYGGDTVTYDLIQIAVYMGFSEIYLLGVDHTMLSSNIHFYENETVAKGLESNERIVTQAYHVAAEEAKKRGTNIYNATRGGKLEVFPRVAFDTLFDNVISPQ